MSRGEWRCENCHQCEDIGIPGRIQCRIDGSIMDADDHCGVFTWSAKFEKEQEDDDVQGE